MLSLFQNQLVDYVLSGHAVLNVETTEKQRAIDEIQGAVGADDSPLKEYVVVTWSVVEGLVGKDRDATDPIMALRTILATDLPTIFVLKDFAPYVEPVAFSQADVVISLLDLACRTLPSQRSVVVMVGTGFRSPPPLQTSVTNLEFSLPDIASIDRAIRYVCAGVVGSMSVTDDDISQAASACRGMSQQQVIDRCALVVRKTKGLGEAAVKLLLHEKGNIIRASDLLSYNDPVPGLLDSIGGYEPLKQYLTIDRACFSDEARSHHVDPPKGILLVGVSGTGKTLFAQGVASYFGVPLITMDVANLMNQYVGNSERNMASAIRLLEAVSPCVLMIDEIEKSFAGSSGDNDSGATRRVFGQFLRWLNDRTSQVYVVATANNIATLPPEFTRKGRFDEIFGLDLPSAEERASILRVHLSRREQSLADSELQEVVGMTKDYTGADIEQVVKCATKAAFTERRTPAVSDYLAAAMSVIPLIRTDAIRVNAIREFVNTRTRVANAVTPSGRRSVTL
jgi:hypothetical protein